MDKLKMPMFETEKAAAAYHRFDDDDDDEETSDAHHHSIKEDNSLRKRFLSTRRPLIVVLAITTTSILAILLLATLFSSSSSHPKQIYTSCGTTPAEARLRGCHFDLISFAWQTPECYDAEVNEAFRTHNGANTPWKFYHDLLRKQAKSEAEVFAGENMTVSTGLFHYVHCTYAWRQLHRAYTVLGYVDSHLDNANHTSHCMRTVLGGTPESLDLGVTTKGVVLFPSCRKIY